LDLSPAILAASARTADHRVAGDVDALPLASSSVDVVTCLAVLHHLYDTGALAREAARVLRPGGAFWSDHDMDAAFARRFRWPLAAYRRMRRADRKYRVAAGVDAATYALAEYREDGVGSGEVAAQLGAAGLRATTAYHWYGLGPWTDRVFGERACGRGWGPLASITITAVKR
jgi:SAM-dependent methyltransferase